MRCDEASPPRVGGARGNFNAPNRASSRSLTNGPNSNSRGVRESSLRSLLSPPPLIPPSPRFRLIFSATLFAWPVVLTSCKCAVRAHFFALFGTPHDALACRALALCELERCSVCGRNAAPIGVIGRWWCIRRLTGVGAQRRACVGPRQSARAGEELCVRRRRVDVYLAEWDF